MLEMISAVAGYGREPILNGASLTLQRGELVALIGANGCGKSTLLRTLVGLLPTAAGEVRLDGPPLSSLKKTEVARRVAYLSQGREIPNMTVGELVLCGRFPHLAYPRRYRAEDRVAAARAICRVGLDALTDRPLAAPAGGGRQAAYIAMALASESDAILLDEPTTHLDPAHAIATVRLLRALAGEGRAVLAVMHDLPLAFTLADRILLLDGGRIVLDAPPAEAAASPLIEAVLGVTVFKITGEEAYACRYPQGGKNDTRNAP